MFPQALERCRSFAAVDTGVGHGCHADVVEPQDSLSSPLVDAALCMDAVALERYGRVLRHLAVGLVDQTIRLRLISADQRAASLALGPIQSLIHEPIGWPAAKGRLRTLLNRMQPDPPTTVHALSAQSYVLARTMADAFDADLFLQVASMDDCEGVANLPDGRVAGFFATSKPFARVLEEQLRIPVEHVHLVRPGVHAAHQPACFPDDHRTPTLLCTSPFERNGGVELLIEAVGLLRKRQCELLLFLLGKGAREAVLRRLIRQRRLSSMVTFAHPLGDSSQVMRAADLFIRPSADTAFVVHPLQAMGAGMVVVTFPSAVCDHLRDGETAVLCQQPTPECLADTIERLLGNRDAARKIASAALAYTRANHAMSGMAERTAALYRQFALARATFPIGE